MTDVSLHSLHSKLDFLLQDHGVLNFDDTLLDLDSVTSLHAKADALCSAHGGDPSTMQGKTIQDLQPKLDYLLKGHSVAFDATGHDPSALTTVGAKIDAIVAAHADDH